MRILKTTLAFLTLALPALAYDFSTVQQLMSNPAIQQQVAGAAAANPQLLTGSANGIASMLSNLTPSQTEVLGAQVKAITDKLFTQGERAKLEQFQASPEGASIVSKLPQLAEQMAPVLLQMYMGNAGSVAPSGAAQAPLKLTPAGK